MIDEQTKRAFEVMAVKLEWTKVEESERCVYYDISHGDKLCHFELLIYDYSIMVRAELLPTAREMFRRRLKSVPIELIDGYCISYEKDEVSLRFINLMVERAKIKILEHFANWYIGKYIKDLHELFTQVYDCTAGNNYNLTEDDKIEVKRDLGL